MKPVKIDYCKTCIKHFTSQCEDYKYSHKHTHDDDWCAAFRDKDKAGRRAAG